MASRILGMGDVVSLVERAQQVMDDAEAERLEAKIRKNKFDLEDFLAQIQQLKKMGNVKELMGLIPGMSAAMKNIDIDENSFKRVECIIQSMTPDERAKPDIIDASRKKRIARGSGTEINDINRLLKQFEDMRKMMQLMTKGAGGQRSRAAGLSLPRR
jgi:signal recognition particle subunit SRP54